MAIDGRYSVKFGKLGLLFIAILAVAMVAEFGYMFVEHGKQEILHQEKLDRIEQVRDSMTANIAVYRSIVDRLSVVNRRVLTLVSENSKESQAFLAILRRLGTRNMPAVSLKCLITLRWKKRKTKSLSCS
jgi:Tfp pilus assembly protein PilO